jgi:hypothetical protein
MKSDHSSAKSSKRIELKSFLRDVCLPDLKAKYSYFNAETLRAYLDGQRVPWNAATLNRYMMELTEGGFDSHLNPRGENARKFTIRDRTVVIRPKVTTQPVVEHVVPIEGLLVELFVESRNLSLMDDSEFFRKGPMNFIIKGFSEEKRKRVEWCFLKIIGPFSDGYFRVTLKGPGADLDRLRIPAGTSSGVLPGIEEQLNDRQKVMLIEIAATGSVTTRWCIKTLGIVRDTAVRDINELIGYGLIEPRGKGRGRHYAPKP